MMDERLKAVFDDVRTDDRAHAPSYETIMSAAPRQPLRRIHLAMGAAAVAAALASVVLWPRHINDDVATLTITQWQAPTDVLLDTPGEELLRQLPVLSESVLNL